MFAELLYKNEQSSYCTVLWINILAFKCYRNDLFQNVKDAENNKPQKPN